MAKAVINGIELYYEVHGSGDPVVLIAGLACDSTLWSGILNDLSKHFKVVIFDNRDVGQSQYVNQNYTIEDMVQDTLGLIEHLQLEKPCIVGHSMGGTIAQTIAYKYPSKIKKVVIANSLIKFNARSVAVEKLLASLSKIPIPRKYLLKFSMPWIFSKDFLGNAEAVQKFTEVALNFPFPQKPVGFSRQISALFKFDSRSWFKEIQIPTLVIAGEEDILCPKDSSKLAEGIKGAEYVNFLEMGHVPVLEIPHEFSHHIIQFLKR